MWIVDYIISMRSTCVTHVPCSYIISMRYSVTRVDCVYIISMRYSVTHVDYGLYYFYEVQCNTCGLYYFYEVQCNTCGLWFILFL